MPWPRLPGDSGGFGSLGEGAGSVVGCGEGALTCEPAGVARGDSGGVEFPQCPTRSRALVASVAFVPWGVPGVGLFPA